MRILCAGELRVAGGDGGLWVIRSSFARQDHIGIDIDRMVEDLNGAVEREWGAGSGKSERFGFT